MSTSDLAEARAEALRSLTAKQEFRRGIFIGGTAVAVFAMLCTAAFYPTLSDLLARRSGGEKVDGSERTDSDEGDNSNSMRFAGGKTVDDANLTLDEMVRQLGDDFATFRLAAEARLDDVETQLPSPSADVRGDSATATGQWKAEMFERLNSIDDKIAGLDQVADTFTAFYGSELPDLRKTVEEFPKSEYRQSRKEVQDAEQAAAGDSRVGTLVLNNTTGVEGYVEINGELVWLDQGENDVEAELGEVVVQIPNGGRTYRLDAGLWQQDSDGRYVMNRPSWPPTAP